MVRNSRGIKPLLPPSPSALHIHTRTHTLTADEVLKASTSLVVNLLNSAVTSVLSAAGGKERNILHSEARGGAGEEGKR